MRSKLRQPAIGMALSVLLFAGADAALAGEASGALQVPNVRVIQPSDAQRAAMARWDANAASQALRAYKDPDTGLLRDQTPEEAAKEGLSKSTARRGDPVTITSRHGGKILALDESYMSNSVVTRDASGRNHMQCVTGNEAAQDILSGKSAKEARHDH